MPGVHGVNVQINQAETCALVDTIPGEKTALHMRHVILALKTEHELGTVALQPEWGRLLDN